MTNKINDKFKYKEFVIYKIVADFWLTRIKLKAD